VAVPGRRFAIQVAGIADAADLSAAVEGGATHIGFPLRLPVHTEDCDERAAAALVAALPPGVEAVVITYLERADAIAALALAVGVRTVQLHGEPALDEIRELRRIAPGLALWQALVVGAAPERLLAERVDRLAPLVDAFVTDTFDPASGACGATGRTHDWSVSARLAARSPRPLILAGGLTPENVADAIAVVHPAGVDAHTGVEDAAGRKDPARIRAFAAAARAAAAREGLPA
jgi:phosphoribosylanthranilate isomerase